jgi:hypothetical protein
MNARRQFLLSIFCGLLFTVSSMAAEPSVTPAVSTTPDPVSPLEAEAKAKAETPYKLAAETDATNTPNAATDTASASDTSLSPPPYAAQLRRDAEAVLKSEEFHQRRSAMLPVARPWLAKLFKPDAKKMAPKTLPDFSALAQIMKIVVVLLLLLVLAWLLWRGWQWLSPQRGMPARRSKAGKTQ